MAVPEVSSEPVSRSIFPANREFFREILRFWPSFTHGAAWPCRHNSLYFYREQRVIFVQIQAGNFSKDQGIEVPCLSVRHSDGVNLFAICRRKNPRQNKLGDFGGDLQRENPRLDWRPAWTSFASAAHDRSGTGNRYRSRLRIIKGWVQTGGTGSISASISEPPTVRWRCCGPAKKCSSSAFPFVAKRSPPAGRCSISSSRSLQAASAACMATLVLKLLSAISMPKRRGA